MQIIALYRYRILEQVWDYTTKIKIGKEVKRITTGFYALKMTKNNNMSIMNKKAPSWRFFQCGLILNVV